MYKKQEFTASVAPMMDWTDRHCRWFHRQLSRRVLLYTEMVTANAVIHGDRDYLIGFNPLNTLSPYKLAGVSLRRWQKLLILGKTLDMMK